MAFDPVHGLVPGRFNRRQLILGSGTAVAIAAALAACGSDSKSTTPAATNAPSATEAPTGTQGAASTTPAPAVTSAAATTAPAAGTPKPGGILRVGTKGDVNDGFPSWSPDEKHLVFRGASKEKGGLFIVDIETGGIRVNE